jgi:ferredoxin
MGLSESVAVDKSRRGFLTRFVKPAVQAKAALPALPDGVNILLMTDKCIAWGKGLCDRCERVCPDDALFFVGMMNPRVIESRCSYCDLCVAACPVDAIVIRPELIQEREELLP